MLIHVALLSQSNSIELGELLEVSAALQKQVLRDFSPLWNVSATVDPFASIEDVPIGYWPVIVVDQVATGELGVHGQRDNQPIALVQAKADWSHTASHEILEMLADPFSNRLVAGDSIVGDGHRVEYLVEVCDPCQDTAFGYRVNGFLVSNFYTPQYFDAFGTQGARYDFTGETPGPRTVLEGGYLSWRDPMTNHLHRADMISSQLWHSDLGEVPTTRVTLRSYIDSLPAPTRKQRNLVRKGRTASQTRAVRRRLHTDASNAKARLLKQQLASLKKATPA
jgi:hypothetical protein